jgi:mono/diheme cytochrome c family protein
MSRLPPRVILLASITLFWPIAALHGQQPADSTPDLSPAVVASGDSLFHGVGDCAQCHGDKGVGTPEGPSLTAEPWTLGDGSFPWLLHITRHAGWGMRTRGDEPRPMRGPTVLDSAQVRLVADYVFSISRAKAPATGAHGP